jgi:hypothetical protein
VLAAVRDLNRLELAGESVRAALEALAAAAPEWLGQALDTPGWAARYGTRVDSWRLPTAKTKRDALAGAYGTDGFALLRAVYAPGCPRWLADLPAVQTLRRVLVQKLRGRHHRRGREVITMRDADTHGLPPGRRRITTVRPRRPRRRQAGPGLDRVQAAHQRDLRRRTGHQRRGRPSHRTRT